MKCTRSIPAVVSDLLPSAAAPPGVWRRFTSLPSAPGLLHSGVLLENSDFGLEREIGPDENYRENRLFRANEPEIAASSSNAGHESVAPISDCVWSLYDDLLYDTLYSDAETLSREAAEMPEAQPEVREIEKAKPDFTVCKRRKICRPLRSHLASGVWNLSREQGNKLLASRFKGDCLYICDWPGCIHVEEKRNYMLFRAFSRISSSRGFGGRSMMGTGARLI
ncbi:UNVERIFIED_CONTAM: Phytochrome A-associated F-box protein [Sesamum radiatum]|uniref:Phytochrome A-associated F-box protein n=1 Tax=Sesamum radiatum TaxID=300843 RepID=A0AAW2W3D5_SESRA